MSPHFLRFEVLIKEPRCMQLGPKSSVSLTPSQEASWDGVKETLDFGPSCIQRGSLINTSKRRKWGDMVGSEDCLYLNIWAPKMNPENLQTTAPMPVMLWIHGGSNVSGNADFYNPSALASADGL